MDEMTAFERQIAGELGRMAGPGRRIDAMALVRTVTTPSSRWSATARHRGRISLAPGQGGFTMLSALRFVAAGIIVTLFGGYLLAGVLTTPHGDGMAPAAVTTSPSPMTAGELLSGMVTEEFEPGVFRVIHDGVRDLSSGDYRGVFAGQDGSVWLDHDGYPVRLGVADDQAWQLERWDYLDDLEVAPDGTVWALAVNEAGNDWESTLRSFDGESWTTHRAVDMHQYDGRVEVAPDGAVWAALGDGTLGYLDADGSTWQTIETPTTETPSAIQEFGFIANESDLWAPCFGGALGPDAGIWHYADGTWEHITPGGPDTGAMPDEVFWGLGPGTGSDMVLYRHDATGWRHWSLGEYDMQPGGWTVGPHAVAPDGSFWAGWLAESEEGGSCQGVSHFDGRTWVRYLPGMCIAWHGMAIAPDGSLWVLGDDEGGHALYIITPEAVEGTQ